MVMTKEQINKVISNEVESLILTEGIASLESIEAEVNEEEVTEIIVNNNYGISVSLETSLSQEEVNTVCNEILENSK